MTKNNSFDTVVMDDSRDTTPRDEADFTPLINNASSQETLPSLILFETTGLQWLIDTATYGEKTPYATATILSALKGLQAIGNNIFALEKTFLLYNVSEPTATVLVVFAIYCNTFSTMATRVISNFKYFVRPLIIISKDPLDQSFNLKQTHGVLPLLQETYVIAPENNKNEKIILYKAAENNDGTLKKQELNLKSQGIIQKLFNKSASEMANNLMPIVLSMPDYKDFCEARKKKAVYNDWSNFITSLYYFLAIPCAATAIFSSIVAYLAADTLAEKISLPAPFKFLFNALIVIGNFVSYCTFNYTNMNDRVKDFCILVSKENNLSWPLILHSAGILILSLLLPFSISSATTFLAFYGTAANVGFAYFSMTNFLPFHLFINHLTGLKIL